MCRFCALISVCLVSVVLLAASTESTHVSLDKMPEHLRSALIGDSDVLLDKDGHNWAEDMMGFFKKCSAKATKLYLGARDSVEKWIVELRENLMRMIQSMNDDDKLEKLPNAVPMNGYLFHVPEQMKKMTVKDIKNMCGGRKPPARPGTFHSWFRNQQLQKSAFLALGQPTTVLPMVYSVYDKFPQCRTTPVAQGQCGSCWAFSSSTVMTVRVCIAAAAQNLAIPENFRYSPQYLLNCPTRDTVSSDDLNGCKGGYADYAMRQIGMQPFPSSRCIPYNPMFQMSGTFKPTETCNVSRMKLGGSCEKLGPATTAFAVNIAREDANAERVIMEEIYKYGPVAALMKVPILLMGFTGVGVFRTRPDTKYLMSNGDFAMHYVTITGWGVLNGIKFWEIENSWGEIYGQMPAGKYNFFRLERGVNSCGIESTEVDSLPVTIPSNTDLITRLSQAQQEGRLAELLRTDKRVSSTFEN